MRTGILGGLGGRLGAVLLSLMAHGGYDSQLIGSAPTPKKKAQKRGAAKTRLVITAPARARYWHEGASNPDQAVVMAAADERRRFRADKLNAHHNRSYVRNQAHIFEGAQWVPGTFGLPLRLNPFYVAK